MKTLRDYINLIEDAQTQAPAQAPADPNKLLVFINFASGQGNKEYDLTGIMQKNGWAGTPKQVVTQAEKWLSDYLRQRGDQWTSIQFTYNGIYQSGTGQPVTTAAGAPVMSQQAVQERTSFAKSISEMRRIAGLE